MSKPITKTWIIALSKEDHSILVEEYGGEVIAVEVGKDESIDDAMPRIKTLLSEGTEVESEEALFVVFEAKEFLVSNPQWIQIS